MLKKKKRKTQTTDKGFCLLPWGEYFRNGSMRKWPDSALTVLPVIAIHADRKGQAWPSYDRICALARVSKKTVVDALDFLIDGDWISKKLMRHGRNSHNGYQLAFPPYDDKPRNWIALHREELFFSGVWGAMPPSVRRVYLIFRAFACAGLSAIENGYEIAGYDKEATGEVPPITVQVKGKWEEFDYTEVQFLPAHVYDPAKFAELSGVRPRTFRAAMEWLINNGLICPYDEDADGAGSISGLIIPFLLGIRFPSVLEAVEKAKKKTAPASPGAKRSLTAMRRRAGLG